MASPQRVEAKAPKVKLGPEWVELLEEPSTFNWIMAWVGGHTGYRTSPSL